MSDEENIDVESDEVCACFKLSFSLSLRANSQLFFPTIGSDGRATTGTIFNTGELRRFCFCRIHMGIQALTRVGKLFSKSCVSFMTFRSRHAIPHYTCVSCVFPFKNHVFVGEF